MWATEEECRAVARAREMAERLSEGAPADETSFEGKRLHVLLGWLCSHCARSHCPIISRAYDASRRIYTANDLLHARAAARRVSSILAKVA